MKASLETSALFLSTTLELKNFVSPDLKFHCFLLPNFRSKDSSRIFSDLETTGPFQSMFISASNADCFAFLSDFICFWSIDPMLSTTASFGVLHKSLMQVQGIACFLHRTVLENIRTIRKLSRLSGNFSDYPETFQVIWKLFGPSGKYPDYPETFQTIRKPS